MESHPELKESAKVQVPFLGGISFSVEIHQHLVDLSKLAYNGIVESDEAVKLIFSEEELPQNLDDLGFMDSVTDLYLNQETKSSHNFLHLTFQEFFAAAYISTMPCEEQRKYYQDNIGQKGGRLNVVLKFLSGLKKLDCFTEESAMLIMEESQHKPPCEFISPPECSIGVDVVNWMFEAQSENKISMILGERKIEFKASKKSMSQMDYYSLGYCISHSQCQWVLSLTGRMPISKEKINVLSQSATGSGTGRIVKFGSEVDTNARGEVFISLIQELSHCLNLKALPPMKFNEATLHSILSSTTSLMYLSFKEQFNYEPITEALCNNQVMPLKKLKFEEIELTQLAGQYLIQFLKDTKLLAHFSLIQCVVPAQELLQVFQVVQQNPVIRESGINKCKFQVTCDEDFQCIDQLLVLNVLEETFLQILRAIFGMESKCLTETVRIRNTVDLSNDKLNILCKRTEIKSFIKALFNTTTFAELNISNNQEYLGGSCVLVAEALQQNSTLLTLNMSRNRIGNEGAKSLAEALKHNSTLETLNLSHCNIGNEGAQYLAEALKHNSTLETLNLSQCNIGDEGARYLAEALKHNSTLEALHLCYCSISNEGVVALSHALLQNSSLKILNIGNMEYDDINTLMMRKNVIVKGAQYLAEALEHNTTLEELNLSYCNISNDGTIALSQALLKNSSLKVLSLRMNGIMETGVVCLSDTLEQNSTLMHLHLSYNIIGVEGATSLAKALSNNTTLEELKLRNCSVGDGGVKALSQSLVHNSSLKILGLGYNCISNTGAAAIAEALTQNSTLLHLHLSDNRIGDEGLKFLSEALTHNSTLEELNLSWCEIGDEGAMALSEALYKNSSLKVIHLDHKNGIGQKARKALDTATNHQSIRLSIQDTILPSSS